LSYGHASAHVKKKLVSVVRIERTASCSQSTRAANCATPRKQIWYPRVGTIHRPPPYQDGALPLSYARTSLVGEDGFEPPRLEEDLGYGQVQSTALPLTLEWHLVHDSNVRPPAS
jgi:hypothetical protein